MTPEQAENTDINPEGQGLTRHADPALTLATKKLAGSAHCLNCGTDLKGPFCYYCGQPDRNFMRFFPTLLRDMMEDLLDLDSRFMRTLKPLLFKPGRLTRDYMSGRRFRYAPPMRVYIFSSIVFFLLAAFLSSDAITTNGVKDDNIHLATTSTDEAQNLSNGTLDDPQMLEQKHIDTDQTKSGTATKKPDEPIFDVKDLSFNDQPYDRETNPVDIKWLPDWINERINEEIEGSPQKAEQIDNNPNLIVDKVFDILPATMFVLLPMVALIFKFWFLFAKRYYVEHLIFSLHNHSFLFVSLTLILLANTSDTLLINSGHQTAATAVGWLVALISIWIPLYLLISLRVVYQQNWGLTIVKFAVIGLSYVTLLTLVTSAVAIASFVLL